MSEQHEQWIAAQNLPPQPCGLCEFVSRRMVEQFPDLRLARGHFAPWGEQRRYPHWWCVAVDGTVVDPTAAQFDGVGPGDYVEHGGPEPTGKCLHCGEYTYAGASFCDRTCTRGWQTWMEARPTPEGSTR